ncbi:hypothetical protein [Blastochloris sulfoviridis]|uniref:Uncharacterized protein n=1 Tax=Blastochloris sulfoviridis TaxID=50712 RepID=A0A5M6HW86_9HYPH|nr:hypothetical protein [Blastochloris sulfoviridis]KAA5599888.1 hypothetical protein F1193_10905 [Blastochloris sulfoviridis]
MRWLPTKPVYPPPKFHTPEPPRPPVSPRVLTWWFGGMAILGIAFGLNAGATPGGFDPDRLYELFGLGCLALIALRLAVRRPLTEVISGRAIVIGCGVAVAGFLGAQWLAIQMFTQPAS